MQRFSKEDDVAKDDGYGFGVSFASPVKTQVPDRREADARTATPATPGPSPGSSSATTSPGASAISESVDLGDVPDVSDKSHPKPKDGELRVSETAIYHRMRRVFHPKNVTKRKVSEEMVKQFDKGGRSRKSLQQVFQSCGYNPDKGSKTCYTSIGPCCKCFKQR